MAKFNIYICKNCKKEFKRDKWHKGKFCSHKCYSTFHKNKRNPKIGQKLMKNLSGKKFKYIKVLNKFIHKEKQRKIYWLCKCICGKKLYIRADNIKKTSNCGCKTSELKRKQFKNNYRKTAQKRLYNNYKQGARRRKLKFIISLKDFLNLIKQNCFYCGIEPKNIGETHSYLGKTFGHFKYNGLDRVNNKKDYVLNNVVPCCKICNQAKHSLSKTEFLNWVNKVHLFNRFKSKHKQWSMLLGRYQCLPPHSGHQGLVRQLLKENKNVLIVLRKSDGTEKNPYNFKERKKAFIKLFRKEIKKGKVKIIEFEDVIEIAYGRTPGWGIRQIHLPEKIEKISATEIRKQNEKNKN